MPFETGDNETSAVNPIPQYGLQCDDKDDYEIVIAEQAKNTFVRNNTSKLEIRRLLQCEGTSGKYFIQWSDENVSSRICDMVYYFADKRDRCQVYYIKQKNSHSRLYVEKALLDKIFDSYGIFLKFWDQILNFGPKLQQSDVCHSFFRSRRGSCNGQHYLDECTYGLNYVELNCRNPDGNPDPEPWSVRQCSVYQQYDATFDRVVFILVSPSPKGQKRLEQALRRLEHTEQRPNPFDMHRILIFTALENWRWYIRSLEDRMAKHGAKGVRATVDEIEKRHALVDFRVYFSDQQTLKQLEDRVLDLKIIFDSMLHTVESVNKHCKKAHTDLSCRSYNCHGAYDCNCLNLLVEFEEQIQEVKFNQKKVETLQVRLQGTRCLLSDILGYENTNALKVMAKESKDLVEKSSKDAAAINIVIIITLVYLPVTVVASIFSSQLITVDENGQISVASGAWWFAALAVPLTILTLVAWRAWVAWALWMDVRQQNQIKAIDLASHKRPGLDEMQHTELADGRSRADVLEMQVLGRFRKTRSRFCGILGRQ